MFNSLIMLGLVCFLAALMMLDFIVVIPNLRLCSRSDFTKVMRS